MLNHMAECSVVLCLLLGDGVRLVAVMPYNVGFLPVVLNRLQTSTA